MKKGIGGRVKRVVRGYTELLKEFGCLHIRISLAYQLHEFPFLGMIHLDEVGMN